MKDELRYKFKIKRKCFQNSAREVADGAIYDCVLEMFKDKHSFFVYNSFGYEADTSEIVKGLVADRKAVYMPKLEGRDMFAVAYTGEHNLTVGSYGIMEPTGVPYYGDFDVALIPLLAVNSKGFRLGYGGGYYDRFLKDKNCLKVGIGYSLQLTEELEGDEWDIPLDVFICEKGVYYFGKKTD